MPINHLLSLLYETPVDFMPMGVFFFQNIVYDGEKGGIMKKYNIATYVLIVILIFVFIPLGIAFLVSFNFINTDTSNEWIGFWGGYLGSIIGGIITLYVLFKTLIDGRRLQKREERLAYCDQIVEALAEFNQEVSLLIVRVMKLHINISNNQKNGFEELLGTVYAVEKSEFVLTVKLRSNEADKDYEGIEEINNIIKRIISLLESITNPLITEINPDVNEGLFDEVSKKVRTEQEKLSEETIHFLIANKIRNK